MDCPKCQSPSTKVYDSRPMDNGQRRRRKCLACNHRFTTNETVVGKKKDYFVVCGTASEVLAVISEKEIIERDGVSVVQVNG